MNHTQLSVRWLGRSFSLRYRRSLGPVWSCTRDYRIPWKDDWKKHNWTTLQTYKKLLKPWCRKFFFDLPSYKNGGCSIVFVYHQRVKFRVMSWDLYHPWNIHGPRIPWIKVEIPWLNPWIIWSRNQIDMIWSVGWLLNNDYSEKY